MCLQCACEIPCSQSISKAFSCPYASITLAVKALGTYTDTTAVTAFAQLQPSHFPVCSLDSKAALGVLWAGTLQSLACVSAGLDAGGTA